MTFLLRNMHSLCNYTAGQSLINRTCINQSSVLLVDAGLGVSDLVERGHFESIGIAPLAFVHVVPEGQHHLQKLSKIPALKNLLRCFIESCGGGKNFNITPYITY